MISLKNSEELHRMREACVISARALKLVGEAVEPGITTAELNRIAEKYILGCGARPNFKDNGFPAAACISVNDVVIHGIPGRHIRLREGDIVSVDLGAEYNGYNGDNAATFPCGSISDRAERLISTTRESLYEGIKAARAGCRIGDISSAVQNYVEARGFSVVRQFVGHGVGTELHEEPEVPNWGKAGHGVRLVPGMTIAIEPMVNAGLPGVRVAGDGWTVSTKDGSLSAHFEHTVAVTESGPVILTTCD